MVWCIGDLLDIMQGKFDKRHTKSDVRPEYYGANYIDAVIEDAASMIQDSGMPWLLGYGNHETSVIKRQETDPVQRIAERLRVAEHPIWVGAYAGWIDMRFRRPDGSCVRRHLTHYHHGAGGSEYYILVEELVTSHTD